MNLQKLLLRIMLASLAVTAVTGVITVLFRQDELTMRALGTALVTTAASGALVGLTLLPDRPWARPAGLLGVGLVVAEYILILVLIWWHPSRPSPAAEVWVGLLKMVYWILLTGGTSVACLLWRPFPSGRRPALVGLVLSGLCFVELTVGTWAVAPDAPAGALGDERWLGAAGWTALFGALAVACLPELTARYWPGVGVLAALVGWAAGTHGAFQEPAGEVTETILTVTITVAAAAAYFNLALFLPLPAGWEWVRLLAFAFAGLTAAGLDFLILHQIWTDADLDQPEWAARGTGACAIVAGCATVALLILAAIRRYSAAAGEEAPYPEISLTCPRCHSRQTVRVGSSECPDCGLHFSIRVYEKAEEGRAPQETKRPAPTGAGPVR